MTTSEDETQLPPGAERSDLALAKGAELSSYVIESVLGSGGFGITYLAKHTYLSDK